jgi:hypothetical protein
MTPATAPVPSSGPTEDPLTDPRSATGSCVRCQRTLDLASVKRGDTWYCRSSCAAGLVAEPARVDEQALTNRPRRFYRRRAPKELRRIVS